MLTQRKHRKSGKWSVSMHSEREDQAWVPIAPRVPLCTEWLPKRHLQLLSFYTILHSPRKALALTSALPISILSFKIVYFYFMSMKDDIHEFVCTVCVPTDCTGQKKALEPLELKLQVNMRYHAAKWTQYLHESRKFINPWASSPPSSFSEVNFEIEFLLGKFRAHPIDITHHLAQKNTNRLAVHLIAVYVCSFVLVVCVQVHARAFTSVCAGQRSTPGVIPQKPSILLLLCFILGVNVFWQDLIEYPVLAWNSQKAHVLPPPKF